MLVLYTHYMRGKLNKMK